MFDELKEKEAKVSGIFASCNNEEEKYQKIIELGRQSPPLDIQWKIPENIVKGCQSIMYLHSYMKDGLVFFESESDALISSGLAVLLIKVYSGETPEAILKYPPQFLEDLNITASLTPNRANGLYSMHLRMKQDALKLLVANQ